MNHFVNSRLQTQAKRTLRIEARAIDTLCQHIDERFDQACRLIQQSSGHVIVIGMGKSGHIGHKIAATLASTGTPAFFVHPAEASHGDLGMITAQDVVLALSYSGETQELLILLPIIKRQGTAMIAMTGEAQSTLGRHADVCLNIAVEEEACPLNLAPTASSTVTLALGDALAVALLDAKGFDREDFARSHPGGKLGKRLLTLVSDIMRPIEQLPIAHSNDNILQAVIKISEGGMGFVIISNDRQSVIGVFTDGDLRRLFDHPQAVRLDLSKLKLGDHMHTPAITVNNDELAAAALNRMQSKKITALPVLDRRRQLVGAIHMHDVLKAGIA